MKRDSAEEMPAEELALARRLSRREALGLIGAVAAAPFVGCSYGQTAPEGQTRTTTQAQTMGAATPSCVVRPQQIEGPYFAEERLNRSDIRSDPADGIAQQGVLLRVALRVSRIAGSSASCAPLPGAVVDLWQCNALGVYSDFQDRNGLFDTRGKKFLRGYQVTDAGGRVEFTTIYPGWYPGRAVHLHFKIRTDAASRRGHEFTSQLYFDDSITDQVHARAPYAGHGQRTVRNNRDGIFRRGGDQLLLQLAGEAQGYAGAFDIALQLA